MFATTKPDASKGEVGYNPTYYALSDSTKLSIADENYGAELAFNLSGGGAYGSSKKADGSTLENVLGIEKLNTYNGWLAFGSLKLGAGVWKDGLLDGNYRVKKDADAGSYEGIDFEANKLGSIFKGIPITFIDDMANFGGGSATNYAAYAEYKAKLNDDLQLNVMLSGINSEWTTEKTTALKMGGAARVSML